MQTYPDRPTLGAMLLQHVIVFLICVVFPGLVTGLAPATWVSFDRIGATVAATTRTCLYFLVPYKIQHIEQVSSVSSRERADSSRRERKYGSSSGRVVHVDGEGFLQIHGNGAQLIEVGVSPVSLASVIAKSTEFLNSSQQGSSTFFVIANWKFGALMGGVLSTFTFLYVFGYAFGFFKWIYSRLKSAASRSA